MNIRSVLIVSATLVVLILAFTFCHFNNKNAANSATIKIDEKNYPGDNFFFQRTFPERKFDIKPIKQHLKR